MTAKDLEQMLSLSEAWQVTPLEMDHAARKARLRGGGVCGGGNTQCCQRRAIPP